MKAFKKNLSIKVAEKNAFTTNNQEFVRIKRKVIKRISRKESSKGEIIQSIAEKNYSTGIFKFLLKKLMINGQSGPKSEFQMIPAKNIPSEVSAEIIHNQITPKNEVTQITNPEEQTDLYMPLQF